MKLSDLICKRWNYTLLITCYLHDDNNWLGKARVATIIIMLFFFKCKVYMTYKKVTYACYSISNSFKNDRKYSIIQESN